MASPASEVLVQLAPYPAAFIIEHAKRHLYGAGFIIGVRTADEIIITDFIPHTHADTEVVATRAYRAELERRREAKRRHCSQDIIGWYSASNPGRGLTDQEYQYWCDAPVSVFKGRNCVHLHCEMPDEESKKFDVTWTASIVFEDQEKKMRRLEHRVVVSPVNSVTAEVVLDHVQSMALYDGGKAYARSRMLNMDEVAYAAPLDGVPASEAVVREQKKMAELVAHAEAVVAKASGTEKDQQFMERVKEIRAIRGENAARQENQTGRVDPNTQRFKDALLIKCATTVLDKQVRQLEMLAMTYAEEGANNNNNAAAGAATTTAQNNNNGGAAGRNEKEGKK